ncbi:MAG: hypothetical protein LBL33_01555 [Tannerella sp.]|jgi:hypothetical protein|nr:hypothetical protein [Tannerella sp.]
MRKNILSVIGIGAFALMVGLNLRHAANDYGILDNNLSVEVLAQTNSSGSGSGSGSGSDYGSGNGSDYGSGSGTTEKGCTQITDTLSDEMCSTYPVKHVKYNGIKYGSSDFCSEGFMYCQDS